MEGRKYKIFISALDHSAEVHCANLIKAVKAAGLDVEFVGIGGEKMAETGCEIIENPLGMAEGSARVKLGDTDVVAGIKVILGDPYPDSKDKGVMTTTAELTPLASSDFETGPPSRQAIEIARVVDRGIRESQTINLKALNF